MYLIDIPPHPLFAPHHSGFLRIAGIDPHLPFHLLPTTTIQPLCMCDPLAPPRHRYLHPMAPWIAQDETTMLFDTPALPAPAALQDYPRMDLSLMLPPSLFNMRTSNILCTLLSYRPSPQPTNCMTQSRNDESDTLGFCEMLSLASWCICILFCQCLLVVDFVLYVLYI